MENPNRGYMDGGTPQLTDFPAELLQDVCNYLPLNDIKNWSFVNRHFYVQLLPILHRKDSTQEHQAAQWACRYGFTNVLDRALVAGTDVNHIFPPLGVDTIGVDPTYPLRYLEVPEQFPMLLHIATYYDQIEVMKFLISRGANIKAASISLHVEASFWEPMAHAHSPKAVKLLRPDVADDPTLFVALWQMVKDWAPISVIGTTLGHIRDLKSLVVTRDGKEMTEKMIKLATGQFRPEVLDLFRRRQITCEDIIFSPNYVIYETLQADVQPTNETLIHKTIDSIFRLSSRKPEEYIEEHPDNSFYESWREVLGNALLLRSMHQWVPASVLKRFLDLGVDPSDRYGWPSYLDFYIRLEERHPSRRVEVPLIMHSLWQHTGTALCYALAITLMKWTANHQTGIREKARLMLDYGAAFETKGHPVSFILSTVTWPYSTQQIITHISRLCGVRVFGLRNKYGETHLSSLLSWLTSTPRNGAMYATQMPIEQWAWSIARIAQQLLAIDRYRNHLLARPTDGPCKGLLPIEVIVRHKLSAGCRQDSDMFFRCQSGLDAIMDVLLYHGSRIDTRDYEGRSLIHWAAKLSDMRRLCYLLYKGANVTDLDMHNFTPLHFACQVDVEDVDQDGVMAQSRRRLNIVRKLLWHGATLDAQTDDGRTPLFIACQSLDCKLVSELLRHGAKMLKDKYGRTPYDAVWQAEQKYMDYQRGAIGALSCTLFQHGDVDYCYNPRKEVIDILDGPGLRTHHGLIGRDIEPPSQLDWVGFAYADRDPQNPATPLEWCNEISFDIVGDCERAVFLTNFDEFQSDDEGVDDDDL
ncbi:ankyrin [Annulohypoxylon truncatum]|uniref:ankyrin n=1 Tax=Annulohypoxylon truncatum TaxID=327061 RepID=UPI0020083A24|nr:ankyrin [Annulohypoxylon truncatum]KAI1205865.1 ankyrin [Annulohypoxylon truncatum]